MRDPKTLDEFDAEMPEGEAYDVIVTGDGDAYEYESLDPLPDPSAA